MDTPVVVEILDRRGRLKERQRITRLPATIGRGYGCDVILDDPFVSPEHLRLERRDDGRLFINDLGSTNGTVRLSDERAIAEAELNGDLALRLGETNLRLRTALQPTPPALPLARSRGVQDYSSAGRLTAAWLVLMIIALGSEYLGTYEELRIEALASEVTSTTASILIWSGIWAISNRIVGHHFHYLEHCLNAALWASAFLLTHELSGYLAFSLAADQAITIGSWIVNGALFAGLLHGHLKLCWAIPPRRLAVVAAGISATLTVLLGLAGVVSYFEGPSWDFMLRFRSELKPPMFRVAGSDSVEGFFAKSRELKQRVDELADKQKR